MVFEEEFDARELVQHRGWALVERRSRTATLSDLVLSGGVINLATGDPKAPSHEAVRWAAAVRSEGIHYGGDEELRRRIGEIFEVPPDCVATAVGATAALSASLHVLGGPGTRTAIPNPGFAEYRSTSALVDADIVYYPADGGIPDLEGAMQDARRGVIVINNPTQPGGRVISASEIEEIIRWAYHRRYVLIIDEVLANYVWMGQYASALTFRAPNVVVINGVSKWLGLTGLRVGWAIIDKALRPAIAAAVEAGGQYLGRFQMEIALEALSGEHLPEIAREMRDTARRHMDIGLQTLRHHGVPVADPAGTFYLWPDISATGLSSKEFADQLYNMKSVLVLEGSAFGPAGAKHVRIMPRFDGQAVRAGCDALGQFYRELVTNRPH